MGAFRFELSKVQVQPIRERVVSLIANIASELAERVASALGFPVPQAMPIVHRAANVEITRSVKLSLLARPGGVGMAGMKIAILVADGVDVERVGAMCQLLVDHKATSHPVAERSGAVKSSAGADLHAEASLETAPEVLWDAVILCSGKQAQAALSKHRGAQNFLRDQYLHCKPIVSLGDDSVINAALVPAQPNDSDSGILMLQTRKYGDALATIARRQYFDREVLAKRSRHQSLGGALDWQVASEWRHPHYKRRSRDIARAGRMTDLIARQCLDSGTRHGQRDKSRCS